MVCPNLPICFRKLYTSLKSKVATSGGAFQFFTFQLCDFGRNRLFFVHLNLKYYLFAGHYPVLEDPYEVLIPYISLRLPRPIRLSFFGDCFQLVLLISIELN